jgi:DNA mismatch repair protein MutS
MKAEMMQVISNSLDSREFALGLDPKYGPVISFPRCIAKLKRSIEENPRLQIVHQAKSSLIKCKYQPWTDLAFKIQDCEERMILLENELFQNACNSIANHSSDIMTLSQQLAELDVSIGFAHLAKENSYSRPVLTSSLDHNIHGGRHPVVEYFRFQQGQMFVKNDSKIQNDERLWLLTGANMGGKSTFLRQCAIISIMAQMGSFVPAEKAVLGGKI